jgi:aryl-alcohol dehydrogenase-like predicted oxidoreductase
LHGFDALTPVEETLKTLDRLVETGKVRYLACSNFSGWHLMKSLDVSKRYGWERYVAHQAYYSLIGREYEWELMPLGLDQRVSAIVWSPLGWGRLTGKIRRGAPLPKQSRLHKTAEYGPQVADQYLYNVVDALDVVAKETGKTIPQVALNWLLQRPTVANVIIGAQRGAAASEPGRGGLESYSRTSRNARRRERCRADLSLLASTSVPRTEPVACDRTIRQVTHFGARLAPLFGKACRAFPC